MVDRVKAIAGDLVADITERLLETAELLESAMDLAERNAESRDEARAAADAFKAKAIELDARVAELEQRAKTADHFLNKAAERTADLESAKETLADIATKGDPLGSVAAAWLEGKPGERPAPPAGVREISQPKRAG